jgi:cell wall-associated NlpC family hydrolase
MGASLIVEAARGFLGARFRHQGRSPAGLDCAGLVILVGRSVGALPGDLDVTAYARRPDGRSLVDHCRRHLDELHLGELSMGDVAVFKIETDPQHLAIVGDYPGGLLSMIHAYAPSHRVVENRLDEGWRAQLVGAFRFRQVELV